MRFQCDNNKYYEPRYYKYGDMITDLPVPTYSGYVFDGWYIGGSGEKINNGDYYYYTYGIILCSKFSKEVLGDKEGYISLYNYKDYLITDLFNLVHSFGTINNKSVSGAVGSAINETTDNIKLSNTYTEAKNAYENGIIKIANCIPLANGNYQSSNFDENQKLEILGALESYAIRNGLTGTTLFEDGSYVMFSDRVQLNSYNYIANYGFGVLEEGIITSSLASETNPNYSRYYHITEEKSEISEINFAMDQQGKIYSYSHSGLYSKFMNESADGYVYAPVCASELPEDLSGDGRIWRMPIRWSDCLIYSTNSTIPSRMEYDGLGAQPEDFLTPFKMLLNASYYNLIRYNIFDGIMNFIVGAEEYYNATANAKSELEVSKISFDNVGIKVYYENNTAYIEFEFNRFIDINTLVEFLSNPLLQPVPQSFIDLVGVENYYCVNYDKEGSVVDNTLSLGGYVPTIWDPFSRIVYTRNDRYGWDSEYLSSKYKIPGIVIDVLLASDDVSDFNAFLDGHKDYTIIPKTYITQYISDSRTRIINSNGNFRLNINATDNKTWEYLFGENGIVCTSSKDEYWEVEPALSNPHFVQALKYAINRVEYADSKGAVASNNYFPSAYLASSNTFVNSKNQLEVAQLSYNNTFYHENAVLPYDANTEYGYSYDLAKQYFKVALTEMVEQGIYTPGTKNNPTIIELEIAWMNPNHEQIYHNQIKQYLEAAFNDPEVSNGEFKLNITFWVGSTWSDVYYNKLMTGHYDLGFGSIGGNLNDPLAYMSVLSTDTEISNNFCLNWSLDTNDPNADILVYNG